MVACLLAATRKSIWISGLLNTSSKVTPLIKAGDNYSLNGLYASFLYDGDTITSKDYTKVRMTTEEVENAFGQIPVVKVTYTGKDLPQLEQQFYPIPGKNYFLTEFTLNGESAEVESNLMAPINIDEMPQLLDKGTNRALFIPFDNDKWVRYQSHPLTFDKLTSYEVTAVFNNESRKGFVVGSIEHDNWKTAIEIQSGDLKSSICYGGAADELTRDSKPHGALKGKSIKSPLVLFGLFDDWRTGLEEYADANALIASPKAWDKAVPCGWNSWGVLQFGLTYPKALEVSDFFKNNLQNNHFCNADNTGLLSPTGADRLKTYCMMHLNTNIKMYTCMQTASHRNWTALMP